MESQQTLTETEIAASFKRGNLYSWAEVSRIHQVRMGIYQKNERLISLLTDFGRINPCYPDALDANGERIFYTGNGRRGDQQLTPGNRALLAAIETRHAVPLFNKLAVGEWCFEGFWRVESGEYIFDETHDRMIWQFTLCRS
jgi:hypothetical protein